MTKYSFGFNANERAYQKPSPPVTVGSEAGGLINANSGYANTPIRITNREDFIELFGYENDYNYLNWYNCYDYLANGDLPLTVVRPIADTERNAGKSYSGITLDGDWKNSSNNTERIKPNQKMYNIEQATFNLDNSFSTAGKKMSILNRYVTTDKNIAVSVCSNIHNYEQPIMNEHIRTVSKVLSKSPMSPIYGESYKIDRKVLDIVNVTATDDSITVSGDYTENIKDGSIIIVSGTTDIDGEQTVSGSPVYDEPTNTTKITITFDITTDESDTGEFSYLMGDWQDSNFSTGDIVEYKNGWVVSTITKYYALYDGITYENINSNWVATQEQYNPVYVAGNKSVYSVIDTLSPDLYRANGDIVTFKDVAGSIIDFKDNQVIIVVLKKNEDEVFSFKEVHIGNYTTDHKNDSNEIDFIDDVVLDRSNEIYIKTYIDEISVDVSSVLPDIIVSGDRRDVTIGEYLVIKDLIKNTVRSEHKIKVESVSYDSGTDKTTFTLEDILVGYAVDTETKVNFEYAGKVSTNRNEYADLTSNIYDDTNNNYSIGFGLEGIMIYDFSPTVADYSIVDDSDMNDSAEIFVDKDKLDTNILMSFQTEDEFGNLSVDKMAMVANERKMSIAVVSPFDKRLFLGKLSDDILDSVVSEFGNKRENTFTGQFTQFNNYVTILPTMKESTSIKTGKRLSLSVVGDYSRMLANLDRSNQKLFTPVANVGRGSFSNGNLYFIPNEEQREVLGQNGINQMFFNNRSMTVPCKMSNLTGTLENNDLFKKEHIRFTLNDIENYIRYNVFPIYYKFINQSTQDTLGNIISKKLDYINNVGTIDFYQVRFTNPANDTLGINLNLRFVDVVERVVLNINMYPSTFTIEEITQ